MGLINQAFEVLAILFDKVPVLSKFKGYRSVIGLLGLAVVTGLQQAGIGDAQMMDTLQAGFGTLAALALNSKGRE